MADKRDASSLMEKLKANPGIVLGAVAAVATAGFLFYKKMTANKSSKGSREDTDENEPLELSFFLDAAAPIAENEKLIVKWVNDQVKALLSTNDDKKLTVIQRKLRKTDYLAAMVLIFGR